MAQTIERMPWPEYFMNIAFLVSERSTCLRRKVGALAVKDKRILATGYNGAPAGTSHCSVTGCLRQELGIPSGQRHEICRGLHAEQNVIIQSSIYGVSLVGADIYCTNQPCVQCAKMLINCGVRQIFYSQAYHDELACSMLQEAGVRLESLKVTPAGPNMHINPD